jgi:hypothetical protein
MFPFDCFELTFEGEASTDSANQRVLIKMAEHYRFDQESVRQACLSPCKQRLADPRARTFGAFGD